MTKIICPHCGDEEEKTEVQHFCSKCGQKIEKNNPSSEHRNTTNIPTNHTNIAHSSKKQAKHIITNKTYLVPALIVIAFLVGLFTSSTYDHTEEETVIEFTKTSVAQTFVSYYFLEITELDLEFSDIDAELVKKESDKEPGTYKVTGEVVYDQTKYTFTGMFLVSGGIVFSDGEITLDK